MLHHLTIQLRAITIVLLPLLDVGPGPCTINDRIIDAVEPSTHHNFVSISSFVSSNRILPFVYTFSGIFVELLKVIQSAGTSNGHCNICLVVSGP